MSKESVLFYFNIGVIVLRREITCRLQASCLCLAHSFERSAKQCNIIVPCLVSASLLTKGY